MKRHDLAEIEIRESIADNPDEGWRYAFLAHVLTHLDRPEEAIVAASVAIEKEPDNADSYHAFASAAFLCDRDDEARDAIGQGLQLDPEDLDLLELLTDIQIYHGENQQRSAAELPLTTCGGEMIRMRAQRLLRQSQPG